MTEQPGPAHTRGEQQAEEIGFADQVRESAGGQSPAGHTRGEQQAEEVGFANEAREAGGEFRPLAADADTTAAGGGAGEETSTPA
jgi:hypothetical protein